MERLGSANRLLAVLPGNDLRRRVARSREVALTAGQVLCEPGERPRFDHFPIAGVDSLLIPVDDHANLEVELIGNEGMIGVPLILGATVDMLQGYVLPSGS